MFFVCSFHGSKHFNIISPVVPNYKTSAVREIRKFAGLSLAAQKPFDVLTHASPLSSTLLPGASLTMTLSSHKPDMVGMGIHTKEAKFLLSPKRGRPCRIGIPGGGLFLPGRSAIP
jgi:hypothetical protein